jgi:hypothetical protein
MSEWISIDVGLPACVFEREECFGFNGMISQSIEITDGQSLDRGHYQSDGAWHMYDESEHDCFNVDPADVTHWKPLPKLPK